MLRLLFTLYFAGIHAVGFLGVVLASEELAFVSSGEFLCFVQDAQQTPDSQPQPHHHPAGEPAGHEHAQATGPHQHAESVDPDGPFIHCDPIPGFSPGNLLSLPFEVFEVQDFSCRLEPQTVSQADRLPIRSESHSPLVPPPESFPA